MKKYILPFSFIISVISCSDRTDGLTENKEESKPSFTKLSLKAKQSEVNIFDTVNFYVESAEKDSNIYIYDLRMSYDSIVVKTKGEDKGVVILDAQENSVHMTLTWSNHYYLPETSTAYMYGYKNNKVVLKDSVKVNVKSSKNFLNTNWKDFSTDGITTGYSNIAKPHYFSILKQQIDNIPSIILQNRWDIPNSSDNLFYTNQNKDILKNYITKLYSKPTYTIEANGSLEEVYSSNFSAKLNGEKPLAIWITPTSKISLMEYTSFSSNVNYKIYAEPVNK
ncbi:hypothetical protein [Elizabethkingia miricola]|uniref:hypothetical protein n=1 Tax=Elizabethkingia miricola TaxID=172045 RepID=UPI001F1D6ED0|nr:hypothetical protein [Elizabethkingia miricola]UIO96736.1 hypothetical protein LYZ41_01330 [Elizabethkingia miricola]WER13523.1 hypothetical protein P0M31_01340 [Elizabethkingia miricola]WGL73696.1 hypothetical protein QFB80_01330 [Elizabethkingia miricola]WNG65424.1 hypothetical protein M9H57_01330 [Elizabethkingia miricola]